MTRAKRATPARQLLSRREAADRLGMSVSSFERHVQPFVRLVVVGQLILVAPAELVRWESEHTREPLG